MPVSVNVAGGQVTASWSGPSTLTLVKVDGDGRRTGLAIKVDGPSVTLPASAPTVGGHWEASLYDGVVKRTYSLNANGSR